VKAKDVPTRNVAIWCSNWRGQALLSVPKRDKLIGESSVAYSFFSLPEYVGSILTQTAEHEVIGGSAFDDRQRQPSIAKLAVLK
jgi:hypothetical protein